MFHSRIGHARSKVLDYKYTLLRFFQPNLKLSSAGLTDVTQAQPVFISWTGKNPPFQLRLVDDQLRNITVFATNISTDWYSWIPSHSLKDSEIYLIQISDSKKRTDRQPFLLKRNPGIVRHFQPGLEGRQLEDSSIAFGPSTFVLPPSAQTSAAITSDSGTPTTALESNSAQPTTSSNPAQLSPPPTGTQGSSGSSATSQVPASTVDSGLTAGAKAGIGIGAVAGFALLLLLGWFIFRLRQRASSKKAEHAVGQSYGGDAGMAELGGDSAKVELGVTQIEMDKLNKKRAAELDSGISRKPIAEMDASRDGARSTEWRG